jgi:hypothetical protein
MEAVVTMSLRKAHHRLSEVHCSLLGYQRVVITGRFGGRKSEMKSVTSTYRCKGTENIATHFPLGFQESTHHMGAWLTNQLRFRALTTVDVESRGSAFVQIGLTIEWTTRYLSTRTHSRYIPDGVGPYAE